MAERFGGKYSPQGNPSAPVPVSNPRPEGQWRVTVLFLSAFAFLFPAFGDGPRDLLFGLLAGGGLVLSAWLTREGMKAEGQLVKQLGGLHIIGTERHEARRIDLQLRGRCGRQGDPGSSR
ncbi:MAG TPA: hypothetical protein PKA03_07175, partial [Tabrizicola sp.]|nr:hypothetical protein [Tabrizicola sp.]